LNEKEVKGMIDKKTKKILDWILLALGIIAMILLIWGVIKVFV